MEKWFQSNSRICNNLSNSQGEFQGGNQNLEKELYYFYLCGDLTLTFTLTLTLIM